MLPYLLISGIDSTNRKIKKQAENKKRMMVSVTNESIINFQCTCHALPEQADAEPVNIVLKKTRFSLSFWPIWRQVFKLFNPIVLGPKQTKHLKISVKICLFETKTVPVNS